MRLTNPLDIHLHLRDTPMLERATSCSARDLRAAAVVPNLIPPFCDLNVLKAYKSRIMKVSENELLTPLITLSFQRYDGKFLEETRSEILDIKLYPTEITINSSGGVSSFDLEALKPTLLAMSALEIPLLIRDEANDFIVDRETNFAKICEKLTLNSPKLKTVTEHITTKTLCKLLKDHESLYVTITLHHLISSLDDVIGGKMQPHLFCKPIAKIYEDREALYELVFNGYEKAMFGSDSALHPQNEKEYCGHAARTFSSPVTLSILVEFFEKNSNESNLQKFFLNNARETHKLSSQKNKVIELKKEKW